MVSGTQHLWHQLSTMMCDISPSDRSSSCVCLTTTCKLARQCFVYQWGLECEHGQGPWRFWFVVYDKSFMRHEPLWTVWTARSLTGPCQGKKWFDETKREQGLKGSLRTRTNIQAYTHSHWNTHPHPQKHTHICIHTHTSHTHARTRARTHTNAHTYTNANTHKHTHTHTQSLSNTYTYTHTHIRTGARAGAHTYIHTHTHTHTHMHSAQKERDNWNIDTDTVGNNRLYHGCQRVRANGVWQSAGRRNRRNRWHYQVYEQGHRPGCVSPDVYVIVVDIYLHMYSCIYICMCVGMYMYTNT